MLLSKYDLRGILGEDLDWGIIYNTVKAFLKDTKSKNILIASDFNKNNLKIKKFLKNNFSCEDLGILPTPIFYYQVIKRKIAGIMITASHLPLKYSGLKFILKDGRSWKVSKIEEGRRKIQNSRSEKQEASFKKEKNVYEDYFRKLKSIVKPKKKIFVEFDLKNFFLKTSLPYFKKLNIFPKKNSLLKIKSDFDNDRIYLYYKKRQVLPDLIFYFLASQEKYKNLGCPIFFSQKLKKSLLQKNKKIHLIKTGHIYFKQAFKKLKIDLAFEPSGHFYLFKDLKTESPYLALSLFLHQVDNLDRFLQTFKLNLYRFDIPISSNKMQTNANKTQTDADEKKINKLYLQKFASSLQLSASSLQKSASLENLALLFKKQFRLKLKKFDGYFLWRNGFYLHLRQSQTENKIRVSFEGDKKYLSEIKKWFKKL